MLVDLARNDLGRVCTPGTVRPTELMEVERFSRVMHIVSTVEGELADGPHPLDALAVTFPAGTVTGAPKRRAMELIAELEPTARGSLRGRGRVLHVRGRPRLLHHDPDRGRRGRARLRADGSRDRRRLGPGGRTRGDESQGVRPPARGPRCAARPLGGGAPMILVVDHYDSFTFNLVQLIESLGIAPTVVKSDERSAEELVESRPSAVILSPGPGRPEDAGCFPELLELLPDETPVLGVCLGHQALGLASGGGRRASGARPREGLDGASPRRGHLRGGPRPVRGRAVPLARRASRRVPRRPRDHGVERRRPGDGGPAPDDCRGSACSSIPSRSSRRRVRRIVRNFLSLARAS